MEEAGDDEILLTVTVADTGVGIKEEDMGKLFGEFVQFDSHTNRGVEGTGLGLAISRNLCRLMNGDITVESRYGEGSVFTATLPQGIMDKVPFAAVDMPETKAVLLYERRDLYAASLVRSLENLAVPVRVVHSPEPSTEAHSAEGSPLDDLYREIEQGKNAGQPHPFVFVSADIAEEVLNRINALYAQAGGTRPIPVALSDVGEISSFRDIPVISMPAYALSIANILNGKRSVSYQEKTGVPFIAPEAKILIVDDNVTNLTVVRGLLALYRMDIHVCTGGMEAITLVKEHSYDLVFMDHMMPGMDGIEATAAIRAWEESQRKKTREFPTPIIALTANAVTGMKEMFLENGFNDYLSKPIEIAKLDELIAKWVPKEKQIKAEEAVKRENYENSANILIAGIDVTKGITMTGGTLEGYKGVLTSFHKDILERLPHLSAVPAENDLPAFAIHVHAIKSAAGTIGAADLSKEAAELESVGKAGDIDTIGKNLPGFYQHLKEMAERIGAALAENSAGSESGGAPLVNLSDTGIRGLFEELKTALEAKDMETIDRVTGELADNVLDTETGETLNAVSDLLLGAKFKAAAAKIDELLSKTGGVYAI
jgi:CheY-like chemotaxis protein